MAPRKVGILANLEKAGVHQVFDRVAEWARSAGYDVVSNAHADGNSGPTAASPFGNLASSALTRMFEGIEMLVTLGGDGTLLYASRIAAAGRIPVLSVNLGSLGFHTQVSPDNLDDCLARLSNGELQVENRMMLQVEVQNSRGESATEIALNDIVISKSAWGHMITLQIQADDEFLTDISADGIIISSPTGSSAYNYAAGGPVVYPGMEAIIFNTLCPHRMRFSALVLPGESTLDITLQPRRPDENAQILTDGQPWRSLGDDETLKISKAGMYLPLIVFENDFYGKLRNKLIWGGLF